MEKWQKDLQVKYNDMKREVKKVIKARAVMDDYRKDIEDNKDVEKGQKTFYKLVLKLMLNIRTIVECLFEHTTGQTADEYLKKKHSKDGKVVDKDEE